MANRKKVRATPPCKDWEPPPGGWRTPNADKANALQFRPVTKRKPRTTPISEKPTGR